MLKPRSAPAVAWAWRSMLFVVLWGTPLMIDPFGLQPFTVPKQAWVLVGVAVVLALWAISAAWRATWGELYTWPLEQGEQGEPLPEVRPGGNAALSASIAGASRLLAILGGAYVIWTSAAPLIVAQNPLLHLINVAIIPALYLLFWLTTQLSADERPDIWQWRVSTTLAATGGLVAVHALLEAWGCEPLLLFVPTQDTGDRWRTFATLGNPAWTAEYLAVTYPHVHIAIRRWLQAHAHSAGQTWRNRLPWLAWSVFLAAIAVTGSRLGLLAYLAGTLMLVTPGKAVRGLPEASAGGLPAARQAPEKRWLPTTAALMLALALAVSLMLPYLAQWPARFGDTRSLIGRLLLLRTAGSLIAASPIVGHGAGHFELVAPEHLGKVVAALPSGWLPWLPHSLAPHAHNDLLQVAVEGGLPAMFMLAGAWFLAWRVAGRLGRDNSPVGERYRAVGAGLLALFVAGLGSAPLHTTATAVVFWVSVGMAAAPGNTMERIGNNRSAPAMHVGYARWAAAVTILCSLVAVTIWQAGVLSANRLAAEAEAMVARGRYADAEAAYDRALVKWQWHSETRVKRAALLAQRGSVNTALAEVEKAMRWGVSLEGRLLQAQLLAALHRPDEAMTVLTHALRAVPDFLRARITLAQIQQQAGNLAAAVGNYRMVTASVQQSAFALQLKKQAVQALAGIATSMIPVEKP